MGYLCRCSSNDMDCSYDKENPECTTITIEYMDSIFLTTAPTYTHDFINNPPHCLDPDDI